MKPRIRKAGSFWHCDSGEYGAYGLTASESFEQWQIKGKREEDALDSTRAILYRWQKDYPNDSSELPATNLNERKGMKSFEFSINIKVPMWLSIALALFGLWSAVSNYIEGMWGWAIFAAVVFAANAWGAYSTWKEKRASKREGSGLA